MNTLEDARAWGFVGFKTVAALKKEVDCIPQTKGVYLVLRKEISFPEFAEVKCYIIIARSELSYNKNLR